MQLIHKRSRPLFKAYTAKPPHAILAVGSSCHQPTYEAETLANAITAAHGGTVQSLRAEDEKTGISIDQIRALYVRTRSKQPAGKNVWIIYAADTMSDAAQNAFLKLLEEPPENVVFILTCLQQAALLPTVSSRTQIFSSAPLSDTEAQAWLKEQAIESEADRRQLVFLAEGSPSELMLLASDKNYQTEQRSCAADAKLLISAPVIERIALINTIAAKRERAVRVTYIALTMLSLLVSRRPASSSLQQLSRLLQAYEQLSRNGNVKAQLLRAVI